MSRRNNNVKDQERSNDRGRNCKGSKGKSGKPVGKSFKDKREAAEESKLDPTGKPNNPNWYFLDASLADQVSQLSFQSLAGYPLEMLHKHFGVANVNRVLFNPCPGVVRSADYNSGMLNKTSGVNLAGFRLFSKLSAYTGRIASYAPQDITTMILAMGELVSVTEWCRRCFGIANAYSMRNRSYPREVLTWALMIDDDDFFKNFANYRDRFNTLITMINQLPIPKGIAYFEKCAALYEKVWLDDDSSMAQSIIPSPFTTWYFDETSDNRGSKLTTVPFLSNPAKTGIATEVKTMGYYLDILDNMIGFLLNSTTLQVVYTDLLNLAAKVGQQFWKLDYLNPGYLVVPEFNSYMLLQYHNATITGAPSAGSELTSPHVTPFNDVVPNPNTNTLFYNPGFETLYGKPNGIPRTGDDVIIDMISSTPSVEDRVECTRYTSVAGTLSYSDGKAYCDAVLPDHYVVAVSLRPSEPTYQHDVEFINASNLDNTYFPIVASFMSQIDWMPHLYNVDADGRTYSGLYIGDMNYYTVVGAEYLRRLHQFMTLALYDVRTA